MKCKVTRPIFEKGMLYEAGSVIDLTPERAKALGISVVPLEKPTEPEVENKVIENMADKEIKPKKTIKKSRRTHKK